METRRFGSEEAIGQLPLSLQRLMTFERFHLHDYDRFQNDAAVPRFDRRYLPPHCGAFRLPCFWIHRKHFYVYGAQSPGAEELPILDGQAPDDRVLFPIHPVDLQYYRDFLAAVGAQDVWLEDRHLWAVPTSSTRTLLVWPDGDPRKALFLKTSLHSPIFGDRRILRSRLGGGIGLSRLVQDSQPELPGDLQYLWEPVGFVPRAMQDCGVVVRSIPRDVLDNKVVMAPLFALFGGNGARRPLFLTIVERSGLHWEDFLEMFICRQFAQLWLDLAMRFGLILEAHAQDLLLGLSPDMSPLGRFLYRDFEGLMVDWDLRQARGLAASAGMPNSWCWFDAYATYGHPTYQLASCKLRTSLSHYVSFVLRELEMRLREWQHSGLIGGSTIRAGDVTWSFSHHLWIAIERTFNIRVGRRYDVSAALNKFVIYLMKLRSEVIGSGSDVVTVSYAACEGQHLLNARDL